MYVTMTLGQLDTHLYSGYFYDVMAGKRAAILDDKISESDASDEVKALARKLYCCADSSYFEEMFYENEDSAVLDFADAFFDSFEKFAEESPFFDPDESFVFGLEFDEYDSIPNGWKKCVHIVDAPEGFEWIKGRVGYRDEYGLLRTAKDNPRTFEVNFSAWGTIEVPAGEDPKQYIIDHIDEISDEAAYEAAERIGYQAARGDFTFQEV